MAFALGLGAPAFAQTRPFTVSGVVLDTRGKPLEGAEVRVRADFVYGRATFTTGRDGRYSIGGLIRATYRAEAFVQVPYAGSRVCVQLAMPEPADYNSFEVAQGVRRDFRWQLAGRMGHTDTYFGAAISAWFEDLSSDPARAAVEFTLVPDGPLIDGSSGRTIVRSVPAAPLSLGREALQDIPLGVYRLQATLVGRDGGRTRLDVASGRSPERFAPELAVVWEPEDHCLSASGVKPFAVILAPPR